MCWRKNWVCSRFPSWKDVYKRQGVKGAKDWDYQMSEARRNLDWEKQFELAMDGEKARRYRAESTPEREDTCTMCGKMCAVRNINCLLYTSRCV